MLPKKNTLVAILVLVFSLVAVPHAIAGSPLSAGSTPTQPSVSSALLLDLCDLPKAENRTLRQPFKYLSANILPNSHGVELENITFAQTTPNLPRSTQSQLQSQQWGWLLILAIVGLVWRWSRSSPSHARKTAEKQDLSNSQAKNDLSTEMTPPQTVISEKNVKLSESLTENATETAVTTDVTAEVFSGTETGKMSLTSTELSDDPAEEMIQDISATTPAAEDDSADITTSELAETDPAQSSSETTNLENSEEEEEDATNQNQHHNDPAATPSDLNPSFNETQLSERTPSDIEAAKFNLGQTKPVEPQLASVDEGLAELPDGYGETKIVLMPREPNSAYAYWDIPNEDKEKLRKQGGEQLALRFYDVTGIDMDVQKPHSVRQYDCEEMMREWYIDVPTSDRDYIVEIGYVTEDGHWLRLARSLHVRIPPVYPCDWYGDDFRRVNWEDHLHHKS
ncbi:MAG: DUF4912 domain-containing protein [Microcoleaceae cyanobacterium]